MQTSFAKIEFKLKAEDLRLTLVTFSKRLMFENVLFERIFDQILARCKALRRFESSDEADLTFDYSEIIEILDQGDESFWLGRKPGSSFNGWFPADFVVVLDESRMNYDKTGDLHLQVGSPRNHIPWDNKDIRLPLVLKQAVLIIID